MIRLSKKFIRRAITGLALLAPIVYLFGSQFFYLNGVHGSLEVVGEGDYLSNIETIDANNMFRASGPFTRNGLTYTASNGVISIQGTATTVPSYNQFSFSYNQTFKRDGSKYLFDFPSYGTYEFGLSGYVGASSPFIWSDTNTTTWVGNFYLRVPSVGYEVDIEGFYCNIWNLTEMFGRGNEPTISEFHAKYPLTYYPYGLNHLEYREYTPWPETPTPQSNAYFLFGQFFYTDNFLTDWGRDAISDSPHGFAPFGNMLQFVDENMLHLSDLQIGLMAYGYFYYCAHVLLFVCFFDLTTFFLSWILRITHKFGGADYED